VWILKYDWNIGKGTSIYLYMIMAHAWSDTMSGRSQNQNQGKKKYCWSCICYVILFTGEGCHRANFLRNYSRQHALKIRDKINSVGRLHLHLTIQEHPHPEYPSVEYIFKEIIRNTETVSVTLSFLIPLSVDLGEGMSIVYDMLRYLEAVYENTLQCKSFKLKNT